MRIGEAVANLGIVQDDGEIILVRIAKGTVAHYTLAEVADRELEQDVYLATGTYAAGSVTRHGGRTAANLIRINELPFDFDLSDFTGIPKEDLWAMPDAALWPFVEALRERVEQVFGLLGLPICRMDYTGYGLAVFLRLPLHKPDAVPRLQQLHAAIVERINAVARMRLADPQVKDAGTRIMRLPGCLNTKNPEHPRRARTLSAVEGAVSEAQLVVAAGEVRNAPPQQMIPRAGATLERAVVDQLVSAVQPHWTLGRKHHLSLAISGLLAKAFVPEEQTLAIVERLSAGDENPWDRAKSVHTTYERVRSGLDVKGFYGLKDELPAELLEWLDGIAQRQKTTITFAGGQTMGGEQARRDEQEEQHLEFSDAPKTALYGWIGEYVALMQPTTEAPSAFHLGTALTLSGAVIGRKVSTDYGEPLYANLFSILVGRSGKSRKDTAIKRGTRMLTEPHIDPNKGSITMPEVNIATDVGSAEGLIQILCDKANTMLYLTEFSKLMSNARRQSTGTILPTLMQAWDTPPVMQNTNKASPLEASYPYLTMIAATQPNILADLMSDSDISSGFANRLLFFCGQGQGPIANPPSVDWVAGKLLYRELTRARDLLAGKNLRLSSAASSHWEDWYNADYRKHVDSPEEEEMRARHADNIRKIALIYAVTDGATQIELNHLEMAISVVSWSWSNVARMLPSWGGTIDTKLEAKIRSLLSQRGPMHKRLLQQYTRSRKWGVREYNQVFKALTETGVIEVDPFGNVGLAGS